MTAEIAILNRLAVSLAADSAVTLSGRAQQKVYNTVNKLFALSKYRPVGIMVYGNAEFMGVPWETVIKIHRNSLGQQEFPRLKDYLDDFIKAIESSPALALEGEERRFVQNTVRGYLLLIRSMITERLESAINEAGIIGEDVVSRIASEIIAKQGAKWEAASLLPSIPADHEQVVLAKYGEIIAKALGEVFQEFPLSEALKSQLLRNVTQLFTRNIFPKSVSGVVVAGFGRDDTYPSLEAIRIAGRVCGKAKYKVDQSAIISEDMGAVIVPFAQSEMVATFMEGGDPRLTKVLASFLEEVFANSPTRVLDTLTGLGDDKKLEFLEKWKTVGSELLADYNERMRRFKREEFIDPVINAVAALPKDELAAMAEALVNLTSFKRKVTLETETVGGPIDVAVISKGDGFIWIKRKHYFKPELNPHFVENYFRQ